jgi:CRISPR/Cas system CSM-associated protein Csm4 (group 5 of RAMP superfamily)
MQIYQNSQLVLGEFAPSDEYEAQITETTVFRVVANYGEGETAEAEQRVVLLSMVQSHQAFLM